MTDTTRTPIEEICFGHTPDNVFTTPAEIELVTYALQLERELADALSSLREMERLCEHTGTHALAGCDACPAVVKARAVLSALGDPKDSTYTGTR